MKSRQLGLNGPAVGAIGLGCMGMSWGYGPGDDAESARTLHRALDLGVTLLDTADAYGAGANEELIRRTLAGRRDELTIATKFGMRAHGDGPARTDRPGTYVDNSPAWIRQAADASLRRLGVDTIDLYYAHRRDPGTPVEDMIGAMAGLVQAGKVRYLGLSEVSPETLRAAHAVHPITAVQVEYSLFSRDPEDGLLDTCRELGVALVAYSPVGRGLLTGALRDTRGLADDDFRKVSAPRFRGENLTANLRLVDAVRRVADEIGATPAQAALAWLLAQHDLVIPIPGTRRVAYLQENAAAADLTLSSAQVAALSAAVPPGTVAGDRYNEAGMRMLSY
jgi:aryl-alcohol dehydrogenase-like predicted oxidoreductase